MNKRQKYVIAVFEDEAKESNNLIAHLRRYEKENNLAIDIELFSDPLVFFNNPKFVFDIVFMDIDMPHMDGLTVAKKLRQLDDKAVIVFVTNLRQMAIKGYSVQALDFVIKPFTYDSFRMRMQRAIQVINRKNENYFMLSLPYGSMRMAVSEIYYIEVRGHTLFFHTQSGTVETRGKLSGYEVMFEDYGFLRCNKHAIVNTKHIEQSTITELVVNGDKVQVSRNRRKEFFDKFKEITEGKVFEAKSISRE